MARACRGCLSIVALATLTAFLSHPANAQSFGVELHNTLMPASGAMGGASIAQPQDLTSAVNGNPATLTQFKGTQFTFGGAWAEPTFNLTQTNSIPIVGPPSIEPYSAKSTAPGSPMGNIGVTQDMSDLGMPATFGLGFVTTAGGGIDFRDTPNSHGTNSSSAIFSLPMSVGVDLSERASVGATMAMGIAFFDAPFVGLGGMTPDYALRGTLGANYKLTDSTIAGAYYQTKQAFKFDNAFIFNPGPGQTSLDVRMDLPENIGIGLANTALMDGDLLIALDVLYKLWDDAALYGAVYDDQLVVQVGSQYAMGNYRLRAGYAWAENPIDQTPGANIGGVIQPGALPAVRYTQALLAITSQHRVSAGMGMVDVLPGLDMDLFAGGMFRDAERLGRFTTTSITGYWVGFGLTWRFGSGAGICKDGCSTSIPPSPCESFP